MIPYRFDPDADAEFDQAVAHYEAARPGLGAEFRKAVEDAIATLQAAPQIAAVYPGVRCRQYIMTAFPYSIVYADRTDLIYVLAVAHHRRRPGYWKKRLRRP
ncbi:MAG TPA: type II toxin-antitoxin system RelE/ParE family toxin [Fimbriiglobus sp.]|nr:type II toxin-antitoxin system RelE/ParE family toxin [Fimbriiglobus sp.]